MDQPDDPRAITAADTPAHGGEALPDAEELIERAIDSVLEQVPDVVAPDEPEGSAKLQPWAETAAPPSKNKRPLAELLEQYAERVREQPDAVAGRPRGQHPVVAFFARFTPIGGRAGGAVAADGGAGGAGRKRRGRRGRGAGGAEGAVAAPQPAQRTQPAPVATSSGAPGGSRRSRRRRGGGATEAAATAAHGQVQAPQPPREGGEVAGGGRRRSGRGRGRRRRGGGGGGGGGSAAPGGAG